MTRNLDPPAQGAPPQYPIESVDSALKLLWLIGQEGSVRLTEASQFLGVASSTAHRLLAMLQYRGFVKQNPVSKAYESGPELDRIAFTLLGKLDIRQRARLTLEALSAETGETVHVGVLEGQQIRFVDSIESHQALRVGSRLGLSLPAHCTSTGKAALAELSDDRIQSLYPDERLAQLTEHSLSTRTQLLDAVAAVRRRGFATSAEEAEIGVASIAMAFTPASGPPIGLNVSAPVSRMTRARRRELQEVLGRHSSELKHALS